MARCFAESWQIHKNDTYIPVYNTTFAPYRDRPIRMLEIGVSRGGSLEMWRKYFSPDSVIVGIDSNRACGQFNDPPRNLHVRVGFQQDTTFLQSVTDEFGPFDIILDDGSHLPSPTLASFQHLFAHGLVDGGVYLVEDLWFCYMPVGKTDGEQDIGQVMNPEFSGCPPFVEVVKHLIDVMHQVWVGHNTLDAFSVENNPCVGRYDDERDHVKEELRRAGTGAVDQYIFGVGSPLRVKEHLVPLATTLISRIDLHESIVAIYRQPRDVPRVFLNVTGDNLPKNRTADWFDLPK